MASIKDLKKEVKSISNYYISYINLNQSFAIGEDVEKLSKLAQAIYDAECSTLVKVFEIKKGKKEYKKPLKEVLNGYYDQINEIHNQFSELQNSIFEKFGQFYTEKEKKEE